MKEFNKMSSKQLYKNKEQRTTMAEQRYHYGEAHQQEHFKKIQFLSSIFIGVQSSYLPEKNSKRCRNF